MLVVKMGSGFIESPHLKMVKIEENMAGPLGKTLLKVKLLVPRNPQQDPLNGPLNLSIQ